MLDNIKVYPGMIIQTNYSLGTHKVISVFRNCKCPRYTDKLGYTNTGMEKESPEHIHIHCKDLQGNGYSNFNGYVEKENKIVSVWTTDEIAIISAPDFLQLELF